MKLQYEAEMCILSAWSGWMILHRSYNGPLIMMCHSCPNYLSATTCWNSTNLYGKLHYQEGMWILPAFSQMMIFNKVKGLLLLQEFCSCVYVHTSGSIHWFYLYFHFCICLWIIQFLTKYQIALLINALTKLTCSAFFQ